MTDRDQTTDPYDFGDDADAAALPPDPAFEAWLRERAPSVHAPGAVPSQEMWATISARLAVADAARAGAIPGVHPLRRRPWLVPAALAASLLLGIAIDRAFVARGQRDGAGAVAAGRPTVPASPGAAADVRSDLYRLAAVQTLSQAEALLTAYRAGGAGRNDPAARQLGEWAREVLGSTRLLIDSPAGEDPQLRPLLNDVELVLVQIVQLSGAPLDSTDRALIDRALRAHDLLPRIRTAVPAGSSDAVVATD